MPHVAKSSVHSKLSAQVQWQHPKVINGNIDQTQLAIAQAPTEAVPFSFGVMGDTDTGPLPRFSPSGNLSNTLESTAAGFAEAFAGQLVQQVGNSDFWLHTGDVTYPIGSYQNYLEGFLRPYQSWLTALPERAGYDSDAVVFNRPLLPVPGNHDYAPSSSQLCGRLWHSLLRSLCDRLRPFATGLGLDLGHYGGQGGEAYGQTFLDDLKKLSSEQLSAHLAAHYSALVPNSSQPDALKYCLNYQSGQFTRLPNRYYRYRYGGVDFFALDSNTWNTEPEAASFDQEQLFWLERSLIQSWQTPNTVARVVYLHHSPYTTEAIRWQQSETLWVRRHLRAVLDRVATRLQQSGDRGVGLGNISNRSSGYLAPEPLVDLVLSGHAHCLEHIKTTDNGCADAAIDWVVCGGSGVSLRRQREAGADILEKIFQNGKSHTSVVARSKLYVGIHGHSRKRQQMHSFLRIDVQPHQAQKLLIRPFVVSSGLEGWQTQALRPIGIGRSAPVQPTEQSASISERAS